MLYLKTTSSPIFTHRWRQPTSGFFISDHCFIHTKLSLPKPDLVSKSVSVRKIKSIDLSAFKKDLEVVCTVLLSLNDIGTLALEYDKNLIACLDKHAPVQTKTIVVRSKVPWFDPSLKKLKQVRRKSERNSLKKALRSTKQIYLRSIVQVVGNYFE